MNDSSVLDRAEEREGQIVQVRAFHRAWRDHAVEGRFLYFRRPATSADSR